MLNATETKVLEAIETAAENETGGEFCDLKSIKVEGLSPEQLNGYLVQLQKKGLIAMFDMGTYTQVLVTGGN